jgi:hypothetical protein
MKTSSFAFVVLAITTLVPAASQARCNSDAYRYAQSMHSLSESMVHEFREELSHRRVCGEEARFLQTLRSLEDQCDRLLDGVQEGEGRECLERTFYGIKRTFCSVRERAQGMRVCSCLKELLCKFDRSMDGLADSGFYSRYEPSRHDHDDRRVSRRQDGFPHDVLIQGLVQLLQGR